MEKKSNLVHAKLNVQLQIAYNVKLLTLALNVLKHILVPHVLHVELIVKFVQVLLFVLNVKLEKESTLIHAKIVQLQIAQIVVLMLKNARLVPLGIPQMGCCMQ